MNLFDPEFFPTPLSVIQQMGIDCYGKTVLEPSAGSGNFLKYLSANGAEKILACEKNESLRRLISGMAEIISNDFFHVVAEQVSHVELIVMNPPFSNGASHILHAWQVAPEGCEIIALCNWETIAKDHYGRNRELAAVISDYGEAINLGKCFQRAERTTNVEVGLVRLFKPVLSDGLDMDGFYLTPDNENAQENGVIGFNELRAVVNSYVAAVRCFDKVQAVAAELTAYTQVRIVGSDDKVHELRFGHGLAFNAVHREQGITTKAEFARAYQKECWRYIFRRVGIEKYVTTGVLKDVNKFIESRQNYPFTMRNISRMLDIIIGTREQTMQRAIVEAVDNFTRYTHENRFNVEGWKTNEGHLLNQKFITPYIAEGSTSALSINWYKANWETILDLVKAICFVTGKKFEDIQDVREVSCTKDTEGNWKWRQPLNARDGRPPKSAYDAEGYNKFQANTWYDWGFFRIKLFKKGTGHFQFKNEDDWALLNRAYAKAKGQVLPETSVNKNRRKAA